MAKARFPYGISNFKTMVTEGYHYVDRTEYLVKLEQKHSKYHFFLRPRRFGKSLVVSIMEYYYGKQHKADFAALFGKYHIGKNPTPLANKYLILKFDFSGIRTDNLDLLEENFNQRVKESILRSLNPYRENLTEKDLAPILNATSPNFALSATLALVETVLPNEKVFLLIDEYDHFTNEIIAFHFDSFQKIVSRNGIVRKFYEVAKEGTHSGVIDRLFITGVSPITLDSLTSGFNIGDNQSLDLIMHDFMGFREDEVAGFLKMAGVPKGKTEGTLSDLRRWYNGYLFNGRATNRLYNPDMVLYFVKEYDQFKRYPDNLLDSNVSSDYGKIRRMFNIGPENNNYNVLEEVIENGEVSAIITKEFSFEKTWTRDDFISLLFYMGLLTMKEASFSQTVFQVPNHVITELYFRYFQEILLKRSNLSADDLRMTDKVIQLAANNNIQPLITAL